MKSACNHAAYCYNQGMNTTTSTSTSTSTTTVKRTVREPRHKVRVFKASAWEGVPVEEGVYLGDADGVAKAFTVMFDCGEVRVAMREDGSFEVTVEARTGGQCYTMGNVDMCKLANGRIVGKTEKVAKLVVAKRGK